MVKAGELCIVSKREWVTPELKKLDIDLITAVMKGNGADGGVAGNNKS